MITSPLDLKKRLRRPSRRFDFVALLDVFIIGLFFVMLSPRFVLSPGLTIDLPEGPGNEPMTGLAVAAVLTVRSDDMVLFEGQILSRDQLGPAIASFIEDKPEPAVLIYFDRSVSVQTLLEVSETARQAGVARVQLAAEPGDERADPLFQ